MAYQQVGNFVDPATTLSAGCTSGATSITVNSVANLPVNPNFTIAIVTSGVTEFLLVTGISGATLTVTRAQESTTGAAHSLGDSLYVILTAGALANVLADHGGVGIYANKPTATTGARLGMRYRCTDSPYEWFFDGSLWRPFVLALPCVDPTTQTWSWVNQGGASVNSTNGGIYLLTPASATSALRLYVKATPVATPYKVRVGLIPQLLGVNYQKAGVVWRNSVSGKLLVFYLEYASSLGGFAFSYDSWTSPTGGAAAVATTRPPALTTPMLWMELRDDGTTRYISYSVDGTHYIQFYSELRTTFITPDQVGFVVDEESNLFSCAGWFLSYQEL